MADNVVREGPDPENSGSKGDGDVKGAGVVVHVVAVVVEQAHRRGHLVVGEAVGPVLVRYLAL